MHNPPKNNTPDKALVERLRAAEANCNFGSTLCARDAHAAADEIERLAALSQHGGLVEVLKPFADEAAQFDGTNYSDHEAAFADVSNIAVGDLRRARSACAALASNSPVVGEDGPPETIDGVETGNTVAPNTPTDTADRREAVRRIANDIYLANSDVLCEADCKEIESIVERAIASLIAGPSEGFVMAPVEPTEAMTEAGGYPEPTADRREAVARWLCSYCVGDPDQLSSESETIYDRDGKEHVGPLWQLFSRDVDELASLIAVPDGMVLVPREPTRVMLSAGIEAGAALAGSDLLPSEVERQVWSAMIAAATGDA